MHWFERRIRQYEHRRWTTDDNRRVQAFDWGLEHIGGDRNAADPAAYVREYSKWALEHSRQWFEVTPATDYALDAEGVLTFTSSIRSAWPENNKVHAQFFPAGAKGTSGNVPHGGTGAHRNGSSASKHGSSNGKAKGTSNGNLNGDRNGSGVRPAVVLPPNWNAKW